MSRAFSTDYTAPNGAQSYVPRTGYVIAASDDAVDGEPPHGLAEISEATRHVFAMGYGNINVVSDVFPHFGQPYYFDVSGSSGTAPTPIAVWDGIPHDEKFQTYACRVYYIAGDSNGGVHLNVVSDSGVQSQTNATPNDPGVQHFTDFTFTLSENHGTTVRFELKTDSEAYIVDPPVKITSFFVRREVLTSPLAAGAHYTSGGTLDSCVIPDSGAPAADTPVSPDKLLEIRNTLTVLEQARRCTHWTFAARGEAAHGDSHTLNGGYVNAGVPIKVFTGADLCTLYLEETVAAGAAKFMSRDDAHTDGVLNVTYVTALADTLYAHAQSVDISDNTDVATSLASHPVRDMRMLQDTLKLFTLMGL